MLGTDRQAVQSCFQGQNWIMVNRQELLVTAQDLYSVFLPFICENVFPKADGDNVVSSTVPVLEFKIWGR